MSDKVFGALLGPPAGIICPYKCGVYCHFLTIMPPSMPPKNRVQNYNGAIPFRRFAGLRVFRDPPTCGQLLADSKRAAE